MTVRSILSCPNTKYLSVRGKSAHAAMQKGFSGDLNTAIAGHCMLSPLPRHSHPMPGSVYDVIPSCQDVSVPIGMIEIAPMIEGLIKTNGTAHTHSQHRRLWINSPALAPKLCESDSLGLRIACSTNAQQDCNNRRMIPMWL